jgi:HAE1 family hydrophobic/amphiphilic exporter-1
LPEEDQGYFITFVQAPEGVSLNYTERVLERAEGIMKQIPEIDNIFAVGGFSFSGNVPNQGIIFATLKPWKERSRPDQSAKGLINRLFPQLLSIQEAFVIPIAPPAIQGLGDTGGFEFYLQDRSNRGFSVLAESLFQFLGAVGSITPPKVVGIRPELSVNTPQISVEVDRNKANALQVSLDAVFETLQTNLGSQYVNDFNAFGRAYRVYVQADQQFRSTPDDIAKLYVRSQTGSMIPLANLVQIKQITAPSIINHYNLFRSAKLTGTAAPSVSSGQLIQTLEGTAKQVLPKGIGYEWSGLSLEEIEAGSQGLLIFGFGMIFVFLILSAQYENFIDPLIIMLTVPLAILGALLLVLLRGFSNDVYTQIGFLMLIGMASKNSVLIVEFANQLRHEGLSITKAAVTASIQRFRPILMTSISTTIGGYPLLVASGAGAAARQSLGTAVMGGMIVATVLSLFIAPVLYIVIKTAHDRFTKKLHHPELILAEAEIETIHSNGNSE